MIRFVMRPKKAPVTRGEGLYSVEMQLDGAEPVSLLDVRARNARHAEAKLRFVFVRELVGKVLDFRLEDFTDKEEENVSEETERGAEGPEASPGEGAPRAQEDREGEEAGAGGDG